MEELKNIPGFEGQFAATKDGRIFNIKKHKFSKQRKSENGYMKVWIIDRNYPVHILIAKTFIPNPLNKTQIDHIDTNKTNNNVSNLRWCTPKENSNNNLTKEHVSKAMKGKGTKQIKCIETNKIYNSGLEVCEEFNISSGRLSNHMHRRKGHNTINGYHFIFI